MDLELEHRIQDATDGSKIAIIYVEGKLGPLTVGDLEDYVTKVHTETPDVHHVILDCKGLGYMNSTAAVLMVKFLDHCTEIGGTFQMARCQKSILDVLEVLGFLNRVIRVRESVQDALQTIA